jgi:O-antigen ligase
VSDPRAGLRRRIEVAGGVALAALAVAHPALYGWVPGWADGRATVDASLAELLLVAPCFLLLPLAAAALALRPGPVRPAAALPFLIAGLLFLWPVLQTVPFPAGLHRALSPKATELLEKGVPAGAPALPGAAGAASAPLSVQPRDTRIAALRLGAALSAFLAAFAFVRTRADALRVAVPAVAAGSLLALLGMIKAFAHRWPGAGAVLFPFGGPGPRASGPFVNANQFAGLMEVLFPVAVALVLVARLPARAEGTGAEERAERPGRGARSVLALLACLLTAGAVLVSQSRLGILSFLAGAGILALLLARRIGVGVRAVAAVAALVLAFFLYLGLDPVLDRFSLLLDGEADRVKAWKMGTEIVRDFPLTGTGLGTFRRISPLYQPTELRGGYFQTHNDYVNAASDLGLPGLALLLALAAAWAASAWRGLSLPGRFRPAFAAASLSAAAALAVHSLGDFNLQVGAIAFHAALAAGLGVAAAAMPGGPDEAPSPPAAAGGAPPPPPAGEGGAA